MTEEARRHDGTLDPDASEEEHGAAMNNVVPSYGHGLTRVVAIGGSAGSVPALRRFFEVMPAQAGIAFVVVLHLDPKRPSLLSEVLQLTTNMVVAEASDGRKVQPDHVYVIPPGKHLSLTDGHLRLTDLPRAGARSMLVDLFFRSLADTHGPHSVGIVLSGLDGDGALGVRSIKERGGLTIAQDPEEAVHPSMPRSAIATKMVDWVLTVDAMPARVLAYDAREQRLAIPPEVGPEPGAPRSDEETALRDVLAFVRARTGRDFSYYKRATIVRRLARRLRVNEVDGLPAYLDYLRSHPGEANALLHDLLISVTNFFRDHEAFEALEARVPELFRDKTHTDTVRVWVPACATGEEAYSIAMLLSEHARTLESPPSLQVFATDLDEEALAEGRRGLYPSTITTDVSDERLQRFFVPQAGGFKVRRELRELLLFAPHDLLKDPPFSRLDLVSCRNLLIYLNREAQLRAFELFHFTLVANGRLFLGTAESADAFTDQFYPIDKKHRLYGARESARRRLPAPVATDSLTRALSQREAEEPRASITREQTVSGRVVPLARRTDRSPWSEVHRNLLERCGPPSLIIDENEDILHLSPGMARFLRFPSGEPTANLFRAIHPALRGELRAALFRTTQSETVTTVRGLLVDLGEERILVDIRVVSVADVGPGFALLTIDAREVSELYDLDLSDTDEPVMHQLELEIGQLKHRLRALADQYDVSTEELKASNEELHAMNEELRSATEELESGREELQSMNEELVTVNQELKGKVDELSQANSHLHNLMGATAIATVFLDGDLRIVRFTQPAVALFSLIPADVGRPLAHLHHGLAYPELLVDAARVLEHWQLIEREVGAAGDRFFLARLLPYRAVDHQVAGVVLTFVDVTELHEAREELRRTQHQLELRVQQRTAEIDEMNNALRAEISMHERSEKQRQELQRRLLDAQEQERRRISRELHDEIGQQISALMLAVKAFESELPSSKPSTKLRDVRGIAEQIGREIHQLATQLRPGALDQLGLARALSGYLDNWSARNAIPVDFFNSGIEEVRLPGVVETTLYRIVQEAMNNVYKHASAKNVSVSIERRGDHVLAIVEDDGDGFDLETTQAHAGQQIGIAGMRERVSIAGGTLTIESAPGGGTTVRVHLPLPST